LDIILVILLVATAIWGAYKGGIKIIASLVSFVLAFVLAYTLANTVGNYVRNTSFGSVIEQAVETRILDNKEDMTDDNDINNDEIKEEENADAIAKIEQAVGDKVEEVISQNKELLAEKIINAVFYGMGFLLTFIAVKLALFIIFLVVELIFKLPVLKSFNRIAGCVLELLLTVIKVWMVLGLISFMAPLEFMQGVTNLIGESVITKLLYEHNIIVSLIIGKII